MSRALNIRHFLLRRLLQGQLNECRWPYNQFLEQRKLSWEELEQSLTKFQQYSFIPLMKKESPSLLSVYSQVLRNVGDRVELAMKAFFRRVKSNKKTGSKEKPGFPRFRGASRYDSFCATHSMDFQSKESISSYQKLERSLNLA